MKDEKRWAGVSAVATDLLSFSLLAVSDEMKDVMCQAAKIIEQQRVEISRLQEILERRSFDVCDNREKKGS